MDFSRLEQEMFELLSEAQDAASAGIELVDLSEPLRRANREDGTRAMYDEPTIHIDVTARQIVAQELARVILEGQAARAMRHPAAATAGPRTSK